MREIVLDTETTGLDPKQGHRIIEIAAVEIVDRRPTGRSLHLYLNPERDIDLGATDVHGLTWEMLCERPCFRDVAHDFVEFARGAQWIIHNAPFDIAFLDEELAKLGLGPCASIYDNVVDTLSDAGELHPGKRANLDALCERFGVANAHRTLHGAMLDARLLADVYLAMTRGQESLTIDIAPALATIGIGAWDRSFGSLRIIAPSDDELAAHAAYLAELDRETHGRCVWLSMHAGTVAH